MSGLLDRPGDRPSLMEEEHVVKLMGSRSKAIRDAFFCLKNSIHRTRLYKAKDAFVDLLMERRVQDRHLDTLLLHRPELRFTAPEGWPSAEYLGSRGA